MTAEEVRTLIETDLEDGQIEEFIEVADAWTDDLLGKAGLSAVLLPLVKKWIAAHLIAVARERVTISESAGPAKVSYPDVFGPGLKASAYGQTAIEIDTTGTLYEIAEKRKNIKLRSL